MLKDATMNRSKRNCLMESKIIWIGIGVASLVAAGFILFLAKLRNWLLPQILQKFVDLK
jgi:hypothetical protein